MRILAVSGVPGVGKSTLMLKLIKELGGKATHRYGLCDYATLSGAVVLGRYDPGDAFGGTDKLSMSVEADAVALLQSLSVKPESISVIFEGDRLCGSQFLRSCQILGELRLVVLRVKDATLKERRENRSFEVGKEQNETWLKGRESKVYKVQMAFGGELRSIDTAAQVNTLTNELVDWVLGRTATPAKAGRLF